MFNKILLILLFNSFLFSSSEKYNIYGLIELPSNIYHDDNLIGLELYSANDENFTSTLLEINASSIDSQNSIYSYNFENLKDGNYYILLPIKENDGLKDLNESGIFVKKFNLITGNKREDETYRVYYNDFKKEIEYFDFPYGSKFKIKEAFNCKEEYQEVQITTLLEHGKTEIETIFQPTQICDIKDKYINEIIPIEINRSNREINFKLFEAKKITINLNIDDINLNKIDTKEFESYLQSYLYYNLYMDENSKIYNVSNLESKRFFDDSIDEYLNYFLIDGEYKPLYYIPTYGESFLLQDINISDKINIDFIYPNDENEYMIYFNFSFANLKNESYYYFSSLKNYFNTKKSLSNIDINETLLQIDLNISDIDSYKKIDISKELDSKSLNTTLYTDVLDNNHSNLNLTFLTFKGDKNIFMIDNYQTTNIEVNELDFNTNNSFSNTIYTIHNVFTFDGKNLFSMGFDTIKFYETKDKGVELNSNFNLTLPEINITQEKLSIDTTSLNFNANMGENITKTITITNHNSSVFDSIILVDLEDSKEFVYTNSFSPIDKAQFGEFTLNKTICYMDINESCEINVTYSPINEGADSANIIIRDDRLNGTTYSGYLSTSTDKVVTLIGNGIDKNVKDINLSIPKGWSLLAIPINSTIELAKLNSNSVWIYSNGWIENPEKIEPKVGFWIYSNNNQTINFRGKEYEADFYYTNGDWILSGTGKSLKNISYEYNEKEIWLYNNQAKEWLHNPNEIEAGVGFWLKVNHSLPQLINRYQSATIIK